MATVHEAFIALAQMCGVLDLADLIRNDHACMSARHRVVHKAAGYELGRRRS
jgi:hypothetical protein